MAENQGTEQDRIDGIARRGQVGLREFDEGVVRTIGASLHAMPDGAGEGYFLSGIPGVCPPTGYPGIPVVIASLDDAFSDYTMPIIIVRAMAPVHAPQRWHPGARQYRTAAEGALPVVVTVGDQTHRGFCAYEEMVQAQPTDFEYEITMIGRNRGGWFEGLPRDQVNTVHRHMLQRFSHHNGASVFVRDTAGDMRTYACFLESMTTEVDAQLSERVVQFGISIRVEGEIDISLPTVERAALTFVQH